MLEKYKKLTKDFLNEHYSFCDKSGLLFHKKKVSVYSNVKIGSLAGGEMNGYRVLRIKGGQYRQHILIWFLHYGKWPMSYLDHINGNRSDNRISNLREVTMRQNIQNQKIHRNGKLLGAHFNKKAQRWTSKIVINKKYVGLGNFENEADAHKAYINKCKEMGFIK